MNKFNKLGMELIEYKSELNKSYPPIVIKSLYSSVDALANNGIIDVDTHYSLKGDDTTISAFKELLLTKNTCVKTYNELFIEYEDIRNKFNEKLDINDKDYIQTQSIVEGEKIILLQDFTIKEDFIREYFYIESEKDFETLMSRKNFLHKFAILRLEKILKDFISLSGDELNLTHSSVFYHEKKNTYGIQLLFSYNIEDLENEDIAERLVVLTKEKIYDAIEFYNRKMVA